MVSGEPFCRDGTLPHLVLVHCVVRASQLVWKYSGGGLSGTEYMIRTDDAVILDLEFVALRPELCHAAWENVQAHYMPIEFDAEIRREVVARVSVNMSKEDRYLFWHQSDPPS